jgi:hypothetical protein
MLSKEYRKAVMTHSPGLPRFAATLGQPIAKEIETPTGLCRFPK